jgi:DNA-binding CsgD family transcriptional regulator
MVSLEQRLVPWLGFVSDMLTTRLTHMPHEEIFDQLLATFPAVGVSYNWSQPDGRLGMITRPRAILIQYEEVVGAWQRGEVTLQHPLATWYFTSGDLRPTTCERVPTALVPKRDRGVVMEVLHEVELEQQLSITFRLDGCICQSYVLGRSGTDFTDDDLVVAREIQRLLIGLDRQVTMINHLTQDASRSDVETGLTARECDVLRMIAAGDTTRAIAHHLLCSPRTVNKHLEHIYRKLGVQDRINAIRVAKLGSPC